MKSLIIKLWRTMTRPAVHISLGVLTMGGFIAGVIFWGGFNTALEATNTEEFCIGCHTMKENVYVELQETAHWKNSSGVRATCPDCHVPHEWTAKIARKMQASKEVFAQIFGDLGTPEKFEARRLELARHEWDRFSANGSLECKNCHAYESMDFEQMSPTARIQMKQAADRDQSCVDCHKGIAHHLPQDMASASGIVGDLEQIANGTRYANGSDVISIRHLPLYTDQTGATEAGLLSPASEVSIIAESGDMIEVQIDGWRKAKGFGRVIQEDFGLNISTAILTREVSESESISIGEKKEDELTGLPWEEVSLSLWMKKESMVTEFNPIWNAAEGAYTSNCSTCHSQPEEAHFSANGWVGMLDGMIAFVNFDTDTEALVLKYLQKHSSDFAEGHH
ncbi:pentaheme c-type cytochrome TorC [Vibrio sp. 10N.261.55.A7]|uniref:pentaheme c-type cytochrome TorC n=1 Tax=Vibrio sp. 10N.261.55.A7 TaxID=1880851 RepID=UPI000C848CF1|nr:pentaheme c-type cytochrome TorC [Vibrio sp. 10N.261.55.A7]PMK03888.1 nitrate reductase [Vibrio sp. 10N.261.55.A7]